MHGMAGCVVQVIVGICGFGVQIRGYGVVFMDFDCGVKIVHMSGRGVGCKFDRMVACIEMREKVLKFSLAVCPEHENIINVPFPPEGLVWVGVDMGFFKVGHEDVGKAWCQFGAHGCASYL